MDARTRSSISGASFGGGLVNMFISRLIFWTIWVTCLPSQLETWTGNLSREQSVLAVKLSHPCGMQFCVYVAHFCLNIVKQTLPGQWIRCLLGAHGLKVWLWTGGRKALAFGGNIKKRCLNATQKTQCSHFSTQWTWVASPGSCTSTWLHFL